MSWLQTSILSPGSARSRGSDAGRLKAMSLSNKFAAVAIAVSESIQNAAGDLPLTTAAALVTLTSGQAMCIGEISRVVGLTHSATVRLIDRLEDGALVRRHKRVGREVAVEITARGRRKVDSILEARDRVVAQLLEGLASDDRQAMSAVLDRILLRSCECGMTRERLCRLCRPGHCDCALARQPASPAG